MKSKKPTDGGEDKDDSCPGTAGYLSAISTPLLNGKSLSRSLRLLKSAVALERAPKKTDGQADNCKDVSAQMKKKMKRPVKRGVAEVTKCLRKGEKGIVFLASDVFPVEIIAHLPVFCEEKELLYAFVGTKKTLGGACRSARPASALMVVEPYDTSCPYHATYTKARDTIKKIHPYI